MTLAQPFLVIGSMKCGTTSLNSVLMSHPSIELVAEKESSSFFDDTIAARTTRKIHRSSATVAGEVSTRYMQRPLFEPPVDRVAKLLGNPLLIAVLRDPVERAISHWIHWCQLGWESRPLDEALLSSDDNPYWAFSAYGWQLSPWIQRFGTENMMCMRLEDYIESPSATLQSLWQFLKVPAEAPETTAVNKNSFETRVVARGAFQAIAGSRFYRKAVRPLLPAPARRMLAITVGGQRVSVVRPDPDERLREQFLASLDDDLAKLHGKWDHLTW